MVLCSKLYSLTIYRTFLHKVMRVRHLYKYYVKLIIYFFSMSFSSNLGIFIYIILRWNVFILTTYICWLKMMSNEQNMGLKNRYTKYLFKMIFVYLNYDLFFIVPRIWYCTCIFFWLLLVINIQPFNLLRWHYGFTIGNVLNTRFHV